MIDFAAVKKEIEANKKEIVEKLISFSFTDVLLFWSSNEAVKKAQTERWTPVLHWLNGYFDFNLEKTETLTPPENNKKHLKSFENILMNMSSDRLTAFFLAAVRMKSPLLALALIEGQIDASAAFELAFLEELEQNRRWGEDKEAAESRNQIKNELLEIERFIR